MKIISNFKDYYDYQAYVYGGGDPKIVYVRPHKHKYVPELNFSECEHKYTSIKKLHSIYMMKYNHRNTVQTEVRGIVIGDIFFSQIKTEKDVDYRLLQEKDLKNVDRYYWYDDTRLRLKISDFINHIDSSLIDFCKFVNIPVFMFNFTRDNIYIDINCPNLGKIGVASYITAEQMYQHLSYFIGNRMKDSPDMMKPVVVDDKYKIIAGGFDIKRSFRNMK